MRGGRDETLIVVATITLVLVAGSAPAFAQTSREADVAVGPDPGQPYPIFTDWSVLGGLRQQCHKGAITPYWQVLAGGLSGTARYGGKPSRNYSYGTGHGHRALPADPTECALVCRLQR